MILFQHLQQNYKIIDNDKNNIIVAYLTNCLDVSRQVTCSFSGLSYAFATCFLQISLLTFYTHICMLQTCVRSVLD